MISKYLVKTSKMACRIDCQSVRHFMCQLPILHLKTEPVRSLRVTVLSFCLLDGLVGRLHGSGHYIHDRGKEVTISLLAPNATK